jgi:NAD(P)-dependent dehydrogenase (short-subunit alcohol dehydrogenase family)
MGVALVTGGGRGIGEAIARRLATDGWRVALAARTVGEIDRVASEIGGVAVAADVTVPGDVESMVAHVGRTLGDVELLVANAGVATWESEAWMEPVDDWWHVFEVNVLGVHLCCRAVIPSMLARGGGRIVIIGSAAAFLPGIEQTAYPASKAAVLRYGETLALELEGRIAVFVVSPGLVQTRLTTPGFGPDAPWNSSADIAELVSVLSSGRADALSGRFIHALRDDVDDLVARLDDVRSLDLNVVRLRA